MHGIRERSRSALAPNQAAGWIDPPRLPIPGLEDSCSRTLALAETLLDPAALAATRRAAADFLAGPGPALQRALIDWDERQPGSYVERFWRDLYLRNRAPLPVHQNVAGGFRLPAGIASAPLAPRAALVALAVMDFLRQGESGTLDQDREHGRPLCMRQYRDIAGAVRLPGAPLDAIRRSAGAAHCVVAWRDRFYPLLLAGRDGLRAAPQVAADLAAILANRQAGPGLGLLTALPRDDWAALREALAAANPTSLAIVEDAAFVLCLDEAAGGDAPDLARWLLPGANRWFDKSLQVILSGGAMGGCNLEHSAIDGFTVGRLAHHVAGLLGRMTLPPAPPAAAPAPALRWRLPPALVARIAAAAAAGRTAGGLGIESFEIRDVPGGLRGDLVVQLALQLAYHRTTGRLDSVYQPVHMRRYRAGRTEAVRPVTASSAAFCRWAAAGADDAALAPLARRALRDIAARASDSRNGRGIDRHLFGLQNLAAAAGLAVPLFEDPGFVQLLGPSLLCTSSVPATADRLAFGFGPVRPDGFAVAYALDPEGIAFCITGWRPDLGAFCADLAALLPRVGRLATAALRGC
ncbi:MAG: choline/carnitine O-acyltransferase [Dongiaceae bacterium]